VKLADDKNTMRKASFTIQNERATLLYNQSNKENITGTFFTNFAMIDLLEIMNIIYEDSENRYVTKIDIKSTVANFNGQTFFEIFKHDSTYVTLLEDQLKKVNLGSTMDEAGVESDNILLRRLYWTMLLPTSVQGNNAYGLLGKYDPPPHYEHLDYSNKLKSDNTTSRLATFLLYE
jgi:hypothetical protein